VCVWHGTHSSTAACWLELYLENPCRSRLKMSCIDASRRQLQSAIKIRVKTIFLDKVMARVNS
jgi:hypothetical protein